MERRSTLARRLGKTVHVSPLRFKLEALRLDYPCKRALCLEDWLVVTANARGALVVTLPSQPEPETTSPARAALSDEELVVAICQLNCLDRPQMLRLAAQLVTRGKLDLGRLRRAAILERAEPVLAELSRQALKVAPDHPAWRSIHDLFRDQPLLREPLLHWTRLAEPTMERGKPNASGWRLVA